MLESKIIIPPIKCQGIKTKLVPFIREKMQYRENGVWIEPFLGSGVVAFNILPSKAILSDKNQYIISLYSQIQNGTITSRQTREFLEYHGSLLQKHGNDYYIEMRNKFNENGDPLFFLFLNRSDFNGMIRFNRRGKFNVPFCQKPDRFSKAYITKICNQIEVITSIMKDKDWKFICCPWEETIIKATKNDYVYLDPPYLGRDTSYVGEWSENEAISLSAFAHESPATICLSMWKENQFRKNSHLYEFWSDFTWYEQEHFYHVGAKETNRHPMIEILAIKRT